MPKSIFYTCFFLVLFQAHPPSACAQVFDDTKSSLSSAPSLEVQGLEKEDFRSIDDAFFGMSAGVAIPVGQFASSDFRNYYSGYAENGYYFSLLNGFQKFGRYFGFGLNWQRSQYGFNGNAFSAIYQDLLPQLELKNSTDGDWVVNTFIGSLVMNIPHRVVDVDVRVGAGFGRVVRPEITLEGYERSTGFLSYHWVQAQSVASDASFAFGMNARLHIHQAIDLLFQWDYQRMATTMEVTNIYALSTQQLESLDQQFEYYTFGLGLGFRID